jgi:DNA processing protein
MANGIDTAALTRALDCGGHTAAVIATPLDKFYPKENVDLQERLMREQLVMSQFPARTKTQKYHFFERSRTMALISDATVIIEAGNSSETLAQGWEPLRLGRPLFIAKPDAEHPALNWPAEMLHHGAVILSNQTLDDLFAFLPDREFANELVGSTPF